MLAPKQFWRENFFLQNFIFFHPFESINFQPAGFLAFKEKSGPLLQPYIKTKLPLQLCMNGLTIIISQLGLFS